MTRLRTLKLTLALLLFSATGFCFDVSTCAPTGFGQGRFTLEVATWPVNAVQPFYNAPILIPRCILPEDSIIIKKYEYDSLLRDRDELKRMKTWNITDAEIKDFWREATAKHRVHVPCGSQYDENSRGESYTGGCGRLTLEHSHFVNGRGTVFIEWLCGTHVRYFRKCEDVSCPYFGGIPNDRR